MYEQFIGMKLSIQEIFDTFIDMAVTGYPDDSHYPTIYVTIEFIGTPEEAKVNFKGRRCCIVYGRRSRKGEGVIWNSSIGLDSLVGVWNTGWPGDGTMCNERLVLKADGTGAFAEANMSPYFATDIFWYVENDVLTINTADREICNEPLDIKLDVTVPCMGGDDIHLTCLGNAAYELTFYRGIATKTLEEHEKEADTAYQDFVDNKAFD